jgi:hypothetical protein
MTSHNRKPKAGSCGVCGCAVVQPSVRDIYFGIAAASVCNSGRAWVNGHEYTSDHGKLLQVRCPQHDGLGFPSGQGGDATVQM